MSSRRDRADETDERVSVPLQYLTTVHHASYIAGLRRAQELAKQNALIKHEHDPDEFYGCDLAIDWKHYDQAIDAEVAKERGDAP